MSRQNSVVVRTPKRGQNLQVTNFYKFNGFADFHKTSYKHAHATCRHSVKKSEITVED